MSVPAEVIVSVVDELRALLPERVSTAAAVRERHGHDESYHRAAPPDAVVFPESTEEVARVVELCARHRCPVIPFGTGTSLEGHVRRCTAGVSVDVMRMNAVLEVNAEDLDCRVQPGVTASSSIRTFATPACSSHRSGRRCIARRHGRDPPPRARTRVRYGTMRENVLGLTVVLADGRVVKTGGRARKSAAGYDLTRLFVGSEGTLGVITEIRLRLYGIPEAVSAAVCSFGSLAGAVDTVIQTIQCGVPVARIELLDEVQMDAVNRYSGLDYPVSPTLFFEFHGSEQGVREQVELVGALAGENTGGEFRWATRPEDRSRLWQARHDAYYAAIALRPGSKAWPTDVCVPISNLAECILETRADIDASGLLAPIVGPRRGRELPSLLHPRPRRRRRVRAGGRR